MNALTFQENVTNKAGEAILSAPSGVGRKI